MVNFTAKNYLKIISVFIFLILLCFGFVLLYNKNREVLAQERIENFRCKEIPIGEATEEALAFGKAILAQLENIMSASAQQTRAADTLADIPPQCQADNCDTGCNEYTYDCNCKPCDPNNPDSPTCCETCYACEVLPCSGQACPPYGHLVAEIQAAYNQIDAAQKEIVRLIEEEREPILDKLNEARPELAKCATPAWTLWAPTEPSDIKTVIMCREADFLLLLERGEKCQSRINFLCCQ